MKLLYGTTLIAGMAIALSCGSSKASKRVKVKNCTVLETEHGATITCPDGTTATILHGSNGQDGEAGAAGQDGNDASTISTVVDCKVSTVSEGDE